MPVLPPAVHRTIVAVDVEGFGDRRGTNPHQIAVREGLYRALQQAFRAATIPWTGCHHEDRGDGVLILAPPEVAKSVFVESLPAQLVEGLREHNSTHPAPEQIRLRMALHAGELHYDDHGVTGVSVNLTFRLLDATPLKSALAESPGVLALVTSSWFFDEVVRHSPAANPLAYRPVRVAVKETDITAWVHLPDHPYPLRDPTLKDPPLGNRTTAVPRQLPADTAHFVGRAEELRQLSTLLDSATEDGATVVISAVSGTAGVGKTALALRWAHRVRGGFPDGQLYLDLRGYDPDQPLSAADALAGFLHALGVAGQDIPLEVEERAAVYRSLLDGWRGLVVLDNAATVEQVRLLLPGAPACVVVVTSRDSLAGLVARHGARRLDLDLLPLEDAVALLGVLIGRRVEAEPEAAAELAGQCARLPLALRVAAELAATRPATGLAELVVELADEQRRLELLDAGGDPRTAVRAVLSWSYQYLPAEAARAFRLLGLHPGPDLDPYAAAALTDLSRDQAQRLLDLLARAHLVAPTSPGRYGMHDLLRAYATQLATGEDSVQERRAVLTRLFDYYLSTAAAAVDTLHPAEAHHRPRIPPQAMPIPGVTDPAAARAWLDAERATLTATCAHTAAHGWPGHTTGLSTVLFRYLDVGGHYPDAVAIHTHALHSARDTGDRAAEVHPLTYLGLVHWRQGHYDHAAENLQQALTLAREIGDRVGETRAQGCLGLVYRRQGRYDHAAENLQQSLALARQIGDQAAEAIMLDNLGLVHQAQGRYDHAAQYHHQALTLAREIGHRLGEAHALTNLGDIYERQGRYQHAADHQQQALALFREIGDHGGEADVLGSLGDVYGQQGDYGQAADHFQQALTLAREIGHRANEADVLGSLGAVYRRQGRDDHAADHYQQALALFREIGDRDGEAQSLNGVGETYHATGQPCEARIQHAAALNLAAEIGDRYEQARAHNGLARIYHASSDLDQARYHWHEALALYTDLGVPDADDVRAHLTALDQVVDDDNGD